MGSFETQTWNQESEIRKCILNYNWPQRSYDIVGRRLSEIIRAKRLKLTMLNIKNQLEQLSETRFIHSFGPRVKGDKND